MDMCVRVKRGLVVAGLLLGLGMLWLCWLARRVAAPPAAGVTSSAIVVQGNRRVEADTIRSYFRVAPASVSTPPRSMPR